nr:immunoglobulin heavy chain junction region [Mus musculus]
CARGLFYYYAMDYW